MPVPASAGAATSGSAFFPPNMPNFWNSAAFLQHQQQMSAAAALSGATGGAGSPVPHHAIYPPSLNAFPPLVSPVPVTMPPGFTNTGAPVMSLASGVTTVPLPLGPATPGILSPPAAPSPTFPSCVPTPSPPAGLGPGETTVGYGKLTWLSSQAGLIASEGNRHGLISFQLKNFCDQAVQDLTCVLRPGFSLMFQAIASQVSHDGVVQWAATFVAPLQQRDVERTREIIEAKLEAPPGTDTGPPNATKDPYHMDLENRAVPMLLGIFERNAQHQCQLSSFHCHISNCGDDELYRYIGTSSLKRRQFLERRTHLFNITAQDLVCLQPAALYTTILTLVNIILVKKGGACLMQELFDQFNSCPEIPLEARDMIGDGKNRFLRFLEAHPWIFAVFPSKVFVSVRRQLPEFDYATFLHENFPDMETSSSSSPTGFTRSSGGPPVEAKPQDRQLNGAVGGAPPPSWGPPPPLSAPPTSEDGPPMPGGMSVGMLGTSSGGMRNSPPHHFNTHAAPPQSAPLGPPPSGFWGAQSSSRSPMDDLMAPPPPLSAGLPRPSHQGPTASFWDSAGSMVGGSSSGNNPPPPQVGGRIKRFTDVEIQTEPLPTGTVGDRSRNSSEGKAQMVDSETQTTPATHTIACGEGESELAPEEESGTQTPPTSTLLSPDTTPGSVTERQTPPTSISGSSSRGGGRISDASLGASDVSDGSTGSGPFYHHHQNNPLAAGLFAPLASSGAMTGGPLGDLGGPFGGFDPMFDSRLGLGLSLADQLKLND